MFLFHFELRCLIRYPCLSLSLFIRVQWGLVLYCWLLSKFINDSFSAYDVFLYCPLKIITTAVAVQTMTVSINGPIDATKPFSNGVIGFTAAWAIDAEPKPASFENTARRIPQMMTVQWHTPATALPLNASVKIKLKTSGNK